MNAFGPIRVPSPRLRRTVIALVAVGAVGVTLLVTGWAGSATASPPAGNPTVQGKALVQKFFSLLRDGDAKGLNALLAPSFQVVRANGGVQNKAAYLADPPKVDRFTILKLKGTRAAGVLVASYQVTVTETIAGKEQPAGRAPRLSIFHWENGAWRLVAHANFGAISK